MASVSLVGRAIINLIQEQTPAIVALAAKQQVLLGPDLVRTASAPLVPKANGKFFRETPVVPIAQMAGTLLRPINHLVLLVLQEKYPTKTQVPLDATTVLLVHFNRPMEEMGSVYHASMVLSVL